MKEYIMDQFENVSWKTPVIIKEESGKVIEGLHIEAKQLTGMKMNDDWNKQVPDLETRYIVVSNGIRKKSDGRIGYQIYNSDIESIDKTDNAIQITLNF